MHPSNVETPWLRLEQKGPSLPTIALATAGFRAAIALQPAAAQTQRRQKAAAALTPCGTRPAAKLSQPYTRLMAARATDGRD
jgi:hypothetical protein